MGLLQRGGVVQAQGEQVAVPFAVEQVAFGCADETLQLQRAVVRTAPGRLFGGLCRLRVGDHAHQQARFAVISGVAQAHRACARVAVLRPTGKAEARFFPAFAQRLELLLQLLTALRTQNVDQRSADEFVNVRVAEQLQVVLVGVNVHALVDVGDRDPRALHEQLTALLCFLQCASHLADLLMLGEVRQFPLDDQGQQLGILGGHGICGAQHQCINTRKA